jgi:brefeldin A-inhibited guanine nucleotide-exchange protein
MSPQPQADTSSSAVISQSTRPETLSHSEEKQEHIQVVAPADHALPEAQHEQAKVNTRDAVAAESTTDDAALPPTPPSKHDALPEYPSNNSDSVSLRDTSRSSFEPVAHLHIPRESRPQTPDTPASPSRQRSLTISKGHTVSVVLISTALETISASKEAKRSAPLRDSVKRALEMVRSGQGGDRPREIFEPLRLACETRNEKLMIASLDCISKLIAYSFFAEPASTPTHSFPSPPPSPGPASLKPNAAASHSNMPPSTLVDLVVHTITSCHTETTAETVSLQIVKALLGLILSPTIFVHHSSLLKVVRTVYNVFLLSSDPVNQMVAQGGLTQMVHHVFTRCRNGRGTKEYAESSTPQSSNEPESAASSHRGSFAERGSETAVSSLSPSGKTSNGHAQAESNLSKFAVAPTVGSVDSPHMRLDVDSSFNGSVGGKRDSVEEPGMESRYGNDASVWLKVVI